MAQKAPKNRLRRYLTWMAAVVVIVAAGWGIAWWMIVETVGERMDGIIADAAKSGTTIECGERAFAGWPFRVHVSCRPLRIEQAAGPSISLPAARAVALVYRPRHIIFEADAPADVTPRGTSTPGAIAWSLAQASFQFGAGVPDAVSISIKEPRLSGFAPTGLPDVTAALAEFHMRRAPGDEEDFDIALRIEAATESPVALGAPIGVEVLGVVPASLFARRRGAIPAQSGIRVTRAGIGAAATQLSVDGAVGTSQSGRPDGNLTIKLSGGGDLKPLLERLTPLPADQINAIQQTLASFPKKPGPEGKDQIELPITIKDGAASIGLIPIGQLPALRR